MSRGFSRSVSRHLFCAASAALVALRLISPSQARGDDVSAPVILQYFESKWQTMERRMPDVFAAGYGAIWTPPPGRALNTPGGNSVGYDPYDRFDLGKAGDPTLYGTETGYRTLVSSAHTAGLDVYLDFVHHHVGSWDVPSYTGNPGSQTMNSIYDYPGFVLSHPGTQDADTYPDPPPDSQGAPQFEYEFRLAHLITLNQKQHATYIRNPVPGYANNIPTSGVANPFGRIANLPDVNNRRFYPDASLPGLTVTDPATGGGTYTIHPFNLQTPTNGTPTAEDVTGYMMRYAQWSIQYLGVDGLRIDAARHVPIGQNGDPDVRAYIDRAVYRASLRKNLDGTQRQVFSFQEAYNGDPSFLQGFVRKDINPSTPNVVGGNRDVLDFPLFFAMQTNLSNNGYNNNWYNIRNASFDAHDDGLANNGSQGVSFVISHDNGGLYLDNLGYAFTLLRPGNTIVYYNAREFSANPTDPTDRSFPQLGQKDALGGYYGSAITTLTDIRNRYGRGNYQERWIDSGGFSNFYAFERLNSCLVGLNSRLDGGFDERAGVQTSFAAGQRLIELTGNAGDPTVDPNGDIPRVIVVGNDQKVTLRVPRNKNANNVETDKGYVIYGLPTPTGALTIGNTASVLAPQTPTVNTNATARLSSIDVVTANSFSIALHTNAYSTPATAQQAAWRDHEADGDNALVKMDGGIDLNGNGQVDFTSTAVASAPVYGFEQFITVHNPGYYANSGAGGTGDYSQTIDTSTLSEGYHYVTVRAFRHRSDGGPAVYTDFRQTIYVDRFKPVSALSSFVSTDGVHNENQTVTVRSTDLTADHINVLLDVGSALSDSQVLALTGNSNLSTQTDRDLFGSNLTGMTSGNHAVTVVTTEVDGNYNIQRFPGFAKSTIYGAGVGDTDFNNVINASDVSTFQTVLKSSNQQFNAAADINGDGVIDLADTFLLGPILNNADAGTKAAYQTLIKDSYVTSGTYNVTANSVVNEITANTTNVAAGLSLSALYVRGNALSVPSGSSVTIRKASGLSGGAAGVSVLNSLNIASSNGAWLGKVDLNNNDLIVHGGNLATLTAALSAGYNGGAWNGNGIVSSAAATDATGRFTLGILLNSGGPSGQFASTLDNVSLVSTDVLVRYTYYGDANLDGQVDGTDYTRIDAGFQSQLTVTPRSGWVNGDFNYDSHIDGTDYSLIDASYGAHLTTLSSGAVPQNLIATAAAEIASPAAVPEPPLLGILIVGSAMLLGRRVRRA